MKEVTGADVADGNGEETARGGRDDEAAWRDLIDHFDTPDTSGDTPAPWPERESLAPAADAPRPADPADTDRPVYYADIFDPTDRPDNAAPFRLLVPFDPARHGGPASVEDPEDEEHYVPPPPPPLPALSPAIKGAWAALFGGPIYLLVATLAGWSVPGWAAFGAVAAFIGGFMALVLRIGDQPRRHQDSDDDDDGDGAVV
jgi:hypothetical protein